MGNFLHPGLVQPLGHFLYDLPQQLARRAPDSVLGWRDGQAVCVASFLGHLSAWHTLLAQQPGQQCALFFDDSLEFAAALLACWHAQKTVWLPGDVQSQSCTALLASVDCFIGEFPPRFAPLQLAWEPLQSSCAPPQPPQPPQPALEPDFAALVIHTSGSTGAAQAIPKRLRQLVAEINTLECQFGSQLGQAAIVATVSHQHIYGLLFKLLWPLCSARPIHARSQIYPEALAGLLANGPTALVASPAHLKRLPEYLDWQSGKAQLRAIFSSGGPLPPEVARATGNLLGCIPLEVYGSSETGGIAWRQRTAGQGATAAVVATDAAAATDAATDATTAAADDTWQALPQVEWRITAGALEVRSPFLADDNWLTLADLAQSVGPQRFLLLGRCDRIVKIEEKRISLTAIENLLRASPWVAEVRLCPHQQGQRQQLAAFVVLSAAGQQALAQHGKLALNRRLRDVLVGAIEAVGLPRRWRYLAQMPVNATGKTTEALLLALLEPASPETAPPAARPIRSSPAMPGHSTTPLTQVLEQTPTRVLLALEAPANCLYFEGHFTLAPILPGVVMVDWAISAGRSHFSLPPRFRAIHALKFQAVIVPDYPVQLELIHDAGKGSLQFRYFSEHSQHASGKIMFTGVDHV